MNININRNDLQANKKKYSEAEFKTAEEFAIKLKKEFTFMIKSVILFGSATRPEANTKDIDVLVVMDDLSTALNPETVEAYRIMQQKLINSISPALHVMNLKLTTWWEYCRVGDPIAINILRDGVSLIDDGFFDPLQNLLFSGRIRPTHESISMYMKKAPQSLHNSNWHILQATTDLYWACIDAAHAALMALGVMPPTPEHINDLVQQKLVKTKLISPKFSKTMEKFYKVYKDIEHNNVKIITGLQFDQYYKEAKAYIEELNKFIETKILN